MVLADAFLLFLPACNQSLSKYDWSILLQLQTETLLMKFLSKHLMRFFTDFVDGSAAHLLSRGTKQKNGEQIKKI